jgi:glycosyltransferase involved in cell wall biosynthesis
VKVLVVAEYYPRADDPVLGVWAHRQTLAAVKAGVEVRVLVLHRPIPPAAALRSRDLRRARAVIAQPSHALLDGLEVDYMRYLSPPRGVSYQSWGAWAAPVLRRALQRLRRRFPFELVHAHYAVPTADAVRRADASLPLVISVHGHDVQGAQAGGPAVRSALASARLVIANSAGTERRSRELGAGATRVVHLGTDVPAEVTRRPEPPTLVTVAHLVPRKRHVDVIAALAHLPSRHPGLRYVIVGDGPERERLAALADSHGLADVVELRGQLVPAEALTTARQATLFVLPSVNEAFGVAYIESMAAGVPAIGCAGEDGPEEIARAGGGIVLVPPRDPRALAAAIDRLLSDPVQLASLGAEARSTVQRAFTWERCGRETVAAYRASLEGGQGGVGVGAMGRS